MGINGGWGKGNVGWTKRGWGTKDGGRDGRRKGKWWRIELTVRTPR